MILVIPSIDLKKGVCTGIIAGKTGMENYYRHLSENPLELCRLLRKENSKSLHINDMDAFESKNNCMNINSVLYMASAIDIPIQFQSSFKSAEECRLLLDSGVYRVVIQDFLFSNETDVSRLIQQYTTSRIVFGLQIENGTYHSEHLNMQISDEEFIKKVSEIGGNRILYYEKNWDIRPDSLDLDILAKLSEKYKIKITIVNGIKTPKKLWELSDYKFKGIDSVVIGKPLYDNNFPCQMIWRLIEAEEEDTK